MRQMVAPPHGACVIEARVQVLFASTIDLAMHPVYTRAPFNNAFDMKYLVAFTQSSSGAGYGCSGASL